MLSRNFQPGDWVVYRRTKHTSRPGPRARDISPAPHGEDYAYHVDKFWIVAAIQDDGRLLLKTRRGKTHVVQPDDPSLRRAGMLTQLIYRDRFPARGSHSRDQTAVTY